MNAQRGGDIVVLTMYGEVKERVPSKAFTLVETVPIGYRPAYNTAWNEMLVIDQSPSVSGQFSVAPSGMISGNINREIGQGSYIVWKAVYPTNDAMPA